ncbi:MAG TPA: hypothetical protein VH599_17555 [Ktedonobacterales bacterium]
MRTLDEGSTKYRGMPLVAPPSRRPTVPPPSRRPSLRQGERSPSGTAHQRANVEPPRRRRYRWQPLFGRAPGERRLYVIMAAW